MKRLFLLLAAAVLLLSGAAAGESMPLLEEHGLKISLLSVERSEGQAVLTLHCENLEVWNRTLLLFAPTANGQLAGFLYGWPTDEIILAPLEAREVQITLQTDDPSEWIETAALRFIDAGEITGEATLNLLEQTATAATFSWQDQEAVLANLNLSGAANAEAPIRLQDTLTPDQLKILDYGQLRIALQVHNGDEVQLIPFATAAAEVSADGSVSAAYSGNAIVCSAAPLFPLKMTETHTDAACTYQVSDITLSGPFIFYSTLQLSIREDWAENTVQLLESALDSFDTGPLYGNLPLPLFDTVMLSHPVYGVSPAEGAIRTAEVDVRAQTLLLDAPLSFAIVPANELGEVVAYFEYFFHDGTDVIHPVIPLENK